MSSECPAPREITGSSITLAHGEGGRTMRQWIERAIVPRFDSASLNRLHDAAVLPELPTPPMFTTDSYVVSPRFFPGGDIGSLAVFGTANDLSVSGARPLWISCALIIEEGFALDELARILDSMAAAARQCEVQIVTGDTKVVPRGAADGLFINTAGIGQSLLSLAGPSAIQPGDQLLVSGPIGCHGLAVLSAREGLEFDPLPQSDSTTLFPAIRRLHEAGVAVRSMRDATRGGVTAVLHEWASASRHTLIIEANLIPINPVVRGVSELLGLDPLHCACEGTMVMAVPADQVDLALAALRDVDVSRQACRIGEVSARQSAPVALRRLGGQLVALDEPAGAPLPRIC